MRARAGSPARARASPMARSSRGCRPAVAMSHARKSVLRGQAETGGVPNEVMVREHPCRWTTRRREHGRGDRRMLPREPRKRPRAPQRGRTRTSGRARRVARRAAVGSGAPMPRQRPRAAASYSFSTRRQLAEDPVDLVPVEKRGGCRRRAASVTRRFGGSCGAAWRGSWPGRGRRRPGTVHAAVRPESDVWWKSSRTSGFLQFRSGCWEANRWRYHWPSGTRAHAGSAEMDCQSAAAASRPAEPVAEDVTVAAAIPSGQPGPREPVVPAEGVWLGTMSTRTLIPGVQRGDSSSKSASVPSTGSTSR